MLAVMAWSSLITAASSVSDESGSPASAMTFWTVAGKGGSALMDCRIRLSIFIAPPWARPPA